MDFEIPEPLQDYIIKKGTKFLTGNPKFAPQLRQIMKELLGADKDSLQHFELSSGELPFELTKAGVPPGAAGHLLTVTDAKGRTRYLYFL